MTAVAELAALARAHLRVAGAGEDELLLRLARTALALGEEFTGGAWVVQAQEEVVAASGAWVPLSAEPVAAITGVSGLSVDAYAVDIDQSGCGWVRVSAAAGVARAMVRYEAGLAPTFELVPAPLVQGAVLLAAHLFEDRAGAKVPPAAVAALWRPYRRIRLASPAKHHFAGTPDLRRRA